MRNPTTAFLLELLGYIGLQGIGWFYIGGLGIIVGLILLIGWWVIFLVTLLATVGCCTLPFYLIMPILSGLVVRYVLENHNASKTNAQ
jgi:hypothetical protein